MEIKDSVDSAWMRVLQDLYVYGDVNAGASRDGDVSHELIDYHVTIDASKQRTFLQNPWRKLSPYYAAAETLWYMSGSDRVEMLLRYAPSYVKFADDGGRAYGAYGARIACAISKVRDVIAASHTTRQAVLGIWDSTDVHMVGKTPDMPCTLTWQFLVRGGKLHMIVNMRSNDVWLGFPYDVFAFTCFQRLMASSLGLPVGLYHHNVGSMHLYARNRPDADKACDWKLWKDLNTRLTNDWDYSGLLTYASRASSAERALRCDDEFARVGETYVKTLLDPCGLMLTDLVRVCNKKLGRSEVDLGPIHSGVLAHAVSTVRP